MMNAVYRIPQGSSINKSQLSHYKNRCTAKQVYFNWVLFSWLIAREEQSLQLSDNGKKADQPNLKMKVIYEICFQQKRKWELQFFTFYILFSIVFFIIVFSVQRNVLLLSSRETIKSVYSPYTIHMQRNAV